MCSYYRFKVRRSTGYRLLFYSSLAGTIFFTLATVIVYLSNLHPYGQKITEWWQTVFTVEHSGKAAISLILGPLFAWASNRLSSLIEALGDEASIERAINEKDDPAEQLIQKALNTGTLVSVTLKSGKVYVGQVKKMFNPSFEVQSINLLLSRSGYREEETKKLILDIRYDKTHEKLKETVERKITKAMTSIIKENPNLPYSQVIDRAAKQVSQDLLQFEIVLFVSEIVSINFFDFEIYDDYFKAEDEKKNTNL